MNRLTTQHLRLTSSIILAFCIACIQLAGQAQAHPQTRAEYIENQKYLDTFTDITIDMAVINGYWINTEMEYLFIDPTHLIYSYPSPGSTEIINYKTLKQIQESSEDGIKSEHQRTIIRAAEKGVYCSNFSAEKFVEYKDFYISNDNASTLYIEKVPTNYNRNPTKEPNIDTMNTTELWDLFKATDDVWIAVPEYPYRRIPTADVPPWFQDLVAKAITLETPDCSVVK